MKNFLKKIMGGNEEAPQAKSQVQRSPRVRIPLVDDSVFVSANGKRYPLRNLSETGMALHCSGERFPDEINGDVHVAGQTIYVELLTVRRNGDEVGVTIADGAAEIRSLLRRVFSEEFQALEMTEVAADAQKAVDVGSPRWFYAPGNYELFFVEHEGKVNRFEIEWSGNVLAYAEGVLRFGIVDKDFREAASHARSALVKWQEPVPAESKLKALRMLENIRGLEQPLRAQIQDLLK